MLKKPKQSPSDTHNLYLQAMTIIVTYNNKRFEINSLPPNLSALKNKISQMFLNELSNNFTLKFNFVNNLSKRQHSHVETESQYHFLPKLMPRYSSDISIEVIPDFSADEKRNLVIIEGETDHTISYVNFAEDKIQAKKQRAQLNPSKQGFNPAQSQGSFMDKSQATKPQKMRRTEMDIEEDEHHNLTYGYPNRQRFSQRDPTNWREQAQMIHRCNNCGESTGNVRYTSTGIRDFDLCQDCVQQVSHPYPLIEYVYGKPVRQIMIPKVQRASVGPKQRGYGYSYTPRSGGLSSFFGNGFGRSFDDMFYGFN